MKIQESIDILSVAGYRINKHINKNKYHIYNKFFNLNCWTGDLVYLAEQVQSIIIDKLINSQNKKEII